MHALLAAATGFAATKAWEFMYDSDVVGLADPVTGEIRLACVLGKGGEVFGAVFYRRVAGHHWLLRTLECPEEAIHEEAFEGMDALKVEYVFKRELPKEELTRLNFLGFKPSGKGRVWPQFQSAEPGRPPWFINQAEAEQLLCDLPRLTRFQALFKKAPKLYEDRLMTEFPFLPAALPARPLEVEDLEWRPIVPPPDPFGRFQATDEELAELLALKRTPQAAYEYGCSIIPGCTVLDNGRPCYSRVALLVDRQGGIILGFELTLATISLAQSAGSGLLRTLLKNGCLPGKVLISRRNLETILRPTCERLRIELAIREALPSLDEAMDSLARSMRSGPR